MSPVEFKKMPCRPVEFKGQGPLSPTLAELQLANMQTKGDLYINEINNNISFHYLQSIIIGYHRIMVVIKYTIEICDGLY